MKNKQHSNWGGAHRGQGRKPAPPRIDKHHNLIINVRLLTKQELQDLLTRGALLADAAKTKG